MQSSISLFPSKKGYDTLSYHFLYVHNLEGEFLYLSPEFDAIVGEPSSFFLQKSYVNLLVDDEAKIIQAHSNTSKTLELSEKDPNSIN